MKHTNISSSFEVHEIGQNELDQWDIDWRQPPTSNSTSGFNLSFPTVGFGLTIPSPLSTFEYITFLNRSIAFQEGGGAYSAGILNLLVVEVHATNDSHCAFSAAEVMFHACVGAYNVSIRNSTGSTYIVSPICSIHFRALMA